MNRYQLAALQLQLLQNREEPAMWLGSVSKPSKFSKPDIAYHKGNMSKQGPPLYATNATESMYIWNMGIISENFCSGSS